MFRMEKRRKWSGSLAIMSKEKSSQAKLVRNMTAVEGELVLKKQ